MSIGETPSNPLKFNIYKSKAKGGEGVGKGDAKLRLHLGNDLRITPIYVKTIENREQFLQEKSEFDRTKSLGILRRWAPVTLKDAAGKERYILINIRSAAKRLGVTREEVYKAAKEGNFKQLLLLGQHLGRSELKKIDDFINENRTDLQKEAQNNGQGVVYVRAAKGGLATGLQFNADGTIYIHFNKKRWNPKVGEGSYKRVRLAMNYDTKEICAVARLHYIAEEWPGELVGIQREWEFLQKFKGQEGIAQAIQCVKVNGKRAKTFFIQPLYREGDLFDLIHKTGSVAEKDQLKVALDLLKGAAALQGENVIHRDLHPGNVFLSRDEEGKISAYIGDFGFALNDELKDLMKNSWRGKPSYFSPEYREAIAHSYLLSKSDSAGTTIESATTYKYDAWGLGCIIYEMRHGEFFRRDEGSPYTDPLRPQVSEEEDPLAWLEYDLLRTDRNERLSAEEALRKYGPLLEEKLRLVQ